MRWRVFLPLAALLLVSRGCGTFDPPYVMLIDDSFSDAEEDSILWAMDRWNTAIAEVMDEDGPVLIYGGRVKDDFTVEDLHDGRHVIYRVTAQLPVFKDIDDEKDGTFVGGHGVDEDIHVMQYHFAEWDEAPWLRMLQVIVLHELGHTPFEMMHFTHKVGIMNPEITPEMFQDPRITKADMEQFCALYGCEVPGDFSDVGLGLQSGESVDIPAVISYPDEDE